MSSDKIDLVALVADGQMEAALNGILNRTESLHIRHLSYKILVHGEHDPGCLKTGHMLLKVLQHQYDHALIMFDREGCGKDNLSRVELEVLVERNLRETGWGENSASIVIDPELENWVWTDSPHVERVLGWDRKTPTLREWLSNSSYFNQETNRITKPKEAMIDALRVVGKSSSSSYFLQLAQMVSFERCRDSAFNKLKSVLQNWFPKQ